MHPNENPSAPAPGADFSPCVPCTPDLKGACTRKIFGDPAILCRLAEIVSEWLGPNITMRNIRGNIASLMYRVDDE